MRCDVPCPSEAKKPHDHKCIALLPDNMLTIQPANEPDATVLSKGFLDIAAAETRARKAHSSFRPASIPKWEDSSFQRAMRRAR
mmetsp:Transcript_42673/g.76745  ORF Transcript_42673/g.76745 Transcript_42673/m.76745 type:complete len:84 (+) Transcript_42673:238-489(+)